MRGDFTVSNRTVPGKNLGNMGCQVPKAERRGLVRKSNELFDEGKGGMERTDVHRASRQVMTFY